MKNMKIIGALLALMMVAPSIAFVSDDERIDDYLKTLETASIAQQEQMLNRLQWSGLTSPRLYDVISQKVESQYLDKSLNKDQANLVSYEIRSLGYSGNEKYRHLITLVSNEAPSNKLKRHARKALKDLEQFIIWNKMIADETLVSEGKSAEITSYMKMLNVDNYFVQKLAARAIFYENLNDNDLLDLAADKLKSLYLKENLDSEWQDTAAWLCKAIGQSGKDNYITLLSTVANDSPHRKIQKYARKFVR